MYSGGIILYYDNAIYVVFLECQFIMIVQVYVCVYQCVCDV